MIEGDGTIWQWLIGEPGAAWIGVLMLVVLDAIGWFFRWRRRERPARLVIQEIAKRRLLDIHPSQQNNLYVNYIDEDGTRASISDLRQYEIAVYNDGSTDIVDPLEFSLRFDRLDYPGAPLWGMWKLEFDDDRCTSTAVEQSTRYQTYVRGVRIQLPYLNSYPVHGQYVKGYLISSGPIKMSLWGRQSGKGWSADFVSLDALTRAEHRVSSVLGSVVIGLGLALAVAASRALGESILLAWILLLGSALVAVLWVGARRQLEETILHRFLGARLLSRFQSAQP